MPLDVGRSRQKLRTRRDLLAAARALIDRGETVTVATAADAAGISRATAYRYFSEPAALILEAILDGAGDVPTEIWPAGADTAARVHAVRRYWMDFYRSNEARLRVFVARSMEPGPDGRPRHQRTARRLPMYEEALAPERQRLGDDDFNILVLAIAAVSGFESYITMKDVLGLDEQRIDSLSAVIMDAILHSRLPKKASRRPLRATTNG